MKPINLRVCFKCIRELDGSVSFKETSAKEEKCKCAFCGKECICGVYTVSDYEETNR